MTTEQSNQLQAIYDKLGGIDCISNEYLQLTFPARVHTPLGLDNVAVLLVKSNHSLYYNEITTLTYDKDAIAYWDSTYRTGIYVFMNPKATDTFQCAGGGYNIILYAYLYK